MEAVLASEQAPGRSAKADVVVQWDPERGLGGGGAPMAMRSGSAREHAAPLFCWAVVRPGRTWEAESLPLFVSLTLSQCDAHRVYSNVSRVSGVPTVPCVAGSMDVGKGGMWGTAMNTPIFIQARRPHPHPGRYPRC